MPDNAARTMRQRRAGIVRAMLLLVRGYSAAKNLWLTAPIWTVKHDKDMEACEDMNDKSKPALSLVTPQARHHYTRFDQVDQLVGASEADPNLGFMARMLALCCLPRTNPGNQHQYKRINGPYTLYIIAGGGNKLPYGNLPRLLLAWICTEAIRTQCRELSLGASLSEFMRKLEVISSDSGGSWGIRTRLKNQMERLFAAQISMIYEGERGKARMSSLVADRDEFWWDPKRPEEPSLWQSKIRLGEEFFNEITSHPVPLDMNILKALKRSSLGLDVYLWVIYRTFTLKRPLRLSWIQLYRQFGADPAKAVEHYTVKAFRRDCLRELKKIKVAWPELNYSTGKGGTDPLALHSLHCPHSPATTYRIAQGCFGNGPIRFRDVTEKSAV